MNNAEIILRRLASQGLSKVIFKDPADVVSHLGAVQAQDYAGAKWALGQRLENFSDSKLDSAFNNGSILRTHLLRPTWHFVTPQDIRWMLKLTAPRVHAANAFIYRKTGLDDVTIKQANKAIAKFLKGGNQATRTEIAAMLEKSGISIETNLRLTYFVMRAELDGVICSGARRGKQFTYSLLEERAPKVKEWSHDEALVELSRRYFKTRGPATVQDFAMWSGLTISDAKAGVEMIRHEFASEALNGQVYWFADSNPPVKEKSPTAYLLPNYDEYFIGFKDRSAIGEIAQRAGIQNDDPAMLAHIVILNGQVIGGWKRTLQKTSVSVAISLITKLTKAEKQAVDTAVERFGNYLELPVTSTYKESRNEQRTTRSF